MFDRMVAGATDNQQTLTVTVRFERAVTGAQAAAIEQALQTILGATPKQAARPVAVTPIDSRRRNTGTYPRNRSAGVEYQLWWKRSGKGKARRTYQTASGALAAADRVKAIDGHLEQLGIDERKVGPWVPYSGTPRAGHEYRITISQPGWTSKSTIIRGVAGLEAKIRQNAGTAATLVIDEREVLSGWTPASLEAVA